MSKRIILATVTVLIFNTPAFTDIPRCEVYIDKCVTAAYNGTAYDANDESHVGPFCEAIFPSELGSIGGNFGKTSVCPEQVKLYIQKSGLTYGNFQPTEEICKTIFHKTKELMGDNLLCVY